MKQFAVIGLGAFGYSLAISLMEEGGEVIAIDKDPKIVESIKDRVTIALVMDSTSEEGLVAAGVKDVDCAVVCIGVDMAASILTTLLLKKLGVPKIISRANTELHAEILNLIGVNEVILPEVETGKRLARRLQAGHILNYIELSEDHILAEIKATNRIVGKTIRELDLRARFNVNIVAVKKRIPHVTESGENVFIEKIQDVPKPEDTIDEGDVLVVVGSVKDVESLKRFISEEGKV